MTDPNRVEDVSEIVADLDDVVSAVAIASTLDKDGALRRKLRGCAGCPDDQSLNLELPVGSAGLQLRPDGSIHPVRAAEARVVSNFDTLISQNPELQRVIGLALPRITESVKVALLPFFVPGALPSREEFMRIERWAPLIEAPAYRFCTHAFGELDSWRASALVEARGDVRDSKTVLERYYALIHTVAHLTLVCSGQGATPALSDGAQSFTWKDHTPTYSLVRERTIWLAAAAARSAVAFGAGVINRYRDVLVRASNVTQLFDALFGLTAIGLSDRSVRDLIVDCIAAEAKVAMQRLSMDAEFSDAAFRSATSCLTRSADDAPADHDLLDHLSWRPASLRGLGTPEAFRLDPTDTDETGQMLGFRALPYILRSKAPFHYPLRPRAHAPLLPTLDEMPELLTRAWGRLAAPASTIH